MPEPFDPNIDIDPSVFTGSPERPICIGCHREPEEIYEYSREATNPEHPEDALEPWKYVAAEEGTFNRRNGHFLCTACYIKEGMPTAPGGWVAP